MPETDLTARQAALSRNYAALEAYLAKVRAARRIANAPAREVRHFPKRQCS